MSLEKLLKFGPLVVFDTETTGLEPDSCQIIELAALKIEEKDGKPEITARMDDFVKLPAGERLPDRIVELTGITDEILESEGKSPEDVARHFVEEFLSEPATLSAHNAQFDASFLRVLLMGQKLPSIKWLDTLTVCRDRTFYPHRLESMIGRYNLKGVQNSHRAIDDTLALYELIKALDAEQGDLDKYLNLFGVNAKYGLTGARIKGVTYANQICDRSKAAVVGCRLYDVARRCKFEQ